MALTLGLFGVNMGACATADAATQLDSLRHEAKEVGRDPGELTLTVSPSEPLDPDVVRDYADLGVGRLVLVPPREFWSRADFPLERLEELVRASAPERVGAKSR